MKILITGGTGFIGTDLCHSLIAHNHQLTVLSRRPDQVASLCGETVLAITNLNQLQNTDHFDAIINLAGEGIADSRWTAQRKAVLQDSRIKITEQLTLYIARAETKPEVLISGSAIGFYGNRGDTELHEKSSSVNDFAHKLCQQWENAASKVKYDSVRLCILRTGLVVGRNGGFLKSMLLPFKLGLGGRIGNGKQWMSWIHKNDLIAIIELLLNSPTLQGVFNGTSPNPVTNANFSRCLAKTLHRPAWLPVPAFVLKLLLGEMSELLLGGQKVLPKKLAQQKFKFKFPTLDEALQDVL